MIEYLEFLAAINGTGFTVFWLLRIYFLTFG